MKPLKMFHKINRRIFLHFAGSMTIGTLLFSEMFFLNNRKVGSSNIMNPAADTSKNLGVASDGKSYVYMAQNRSPEQNLHMVLERMGGIEKIIGPTDIVILKPNAQRFNQGMTNTNAMKGFIEQILDMKSFCGEIIIAENHHFPKDETRGWVTEQRNGDFNLNELVACFQKKGKKNVTKYHWHDAGENTNPIEGEACCGRIISGPGEGDGYVWCYDLYYVSPSGRKCLMTYPIFTSTYSGITIDLKHGAWENGQYTNQPVKLINFSALNHHGPYAGVTASIKNLMGIVDLTCGFHGDAPKNCYNVHFIGVDKKIRWIQSHWRLEQLKGYLKDKFISYCYRNFYHAGGALGVFMKTTCVPCLNIIAADLVGWGDRRDLSKSFKPRALLVSTDPVALDYVAAKKILLPGTPEKAKSSQGEPLNKLNDPDYKEGPFYNFLQECHNQGIGNLDPKNIVIKTC